MLKKTKIMREIIATNDKVMKGERLPTNRCIVLTKTNSSKSDKENRVEITEKLENALVKEP